MNRTDTLINGIHEQLINFTHRYKITEANTFRTTLDVNLTVPCIAILSKETGYIPSQITLINWH